MTTDEPAKTISVLCRLRRPFTGVAYRNVGEYLKNLKGSQSLRD